ncbi:hypothetical protein GCM10022630_39810 [Thermobifida alba]
MSDNVSPFGWFAAARWTSWDGVPAGGAGKPRSRWPGRGTDTRAVPTGCGGRAATVSVVRARPGRQGRAGGKTVEAAPGEGNGAVGSRRFRKVSPPKGAGARKSAEKRGGAAGNRALRHVAGCPPNGTGIRREGAGSAYGGTTAAGGPRTG